MSEVMGDPLFVECRENALWLTLNRPDVHNALSRDLMKELLAQLRAAKRMRNLTAIVLTGAGSTFSSGLDLTEVRAMARQRKTIRCEPLQACFNEIATSPLPVMVAMNGPAFAGGAGLALAADFLLVSDQGYFQFPGARKGIVAEVLMPILSLAVGPRRTLDWLTRGVKITAQELFQLGIANEIAPSAKLTESVAAFCNELATIPKEVFASHKLLLRSALRNDGRLADCEPRQHQPVIHLTSPIAPPKPRE